MESFNTDVRVLETPKKVPADKKEYRTIQLTNGLKALLISDLNGVKPGEKQLEQVDINAKHDEESRVNCSIDANSHNFSDVKFSYSNSTGRAGKYLPALGISIGTGKFADPADVQGLMHFLEHMVFMGSKKYPTEDFFHEFVVKHGGDDNGVTDSERTGIHFQIQEQHMRSALDILSQFFISPLITVDAIHRERQVVHSEFLLSLPEDENRLFQLFSVMANETHPISQFYSGNMTSLSGKCVSELRRTLQAYRKKFYVANNMTLALQAKESLDTMQKWVADIFSKVPSGNECELNQEIREKPFIKEKWHKHYGVIPVRENNSVRLYWSLHQQRYKHTSHHFAYIVYLLQYAGKGSILSYLKKRMFAVYIMAELVVGLEHSTNTIFSLILYLTDKGVDHIEHALLVVFQYLELMRFKPPSMSMLKEFHNVQKAEVMHSEQRTPLQNVIRLSENMQLHKPKHYVTGGSLEYKCSPKDIKGIMSSLTMDKCCIVSVSKKYQKLNLCKQKEKWFGTQYFVEDIPNIWEDKFANPCINKELRLPGASRYVCDDFTVNPEKHTSQTYPYRIFKDDCGELWFKSDNQFELPQTQCRFSWENSKVNHTAKQYALLELWKNIFDFVHSRKTFLISNHYYWNINCSATGIRFHFKGISQKFHEVFLHILELWNNIGAVVTEEIFENSKVDLLKIYHNFMLDPRNLAGTFCMFQNPYTPSCQMIQIIKQFTREEFLQFSSNWYKQCYLKMLIQGNVTAIEAGKIFKSVHRGIEAEVISSNSEVKAVALKNNATVMKIRSLNPANSNCVVQNYYGRELGYISEELIDEVIDLSMKNEIFKELRTKERLGYSVSCSSLVIGTFSTLIITVVSHAGRHTVEEVDSKIDQFLHKFYNFLKNLPPSEFQVYIETLKSKKQQVYTSLSEEMLVNWNEIDRSTYTFDRREQQLKVIPSITLEAVVKRLQKIISNECNKYSVQVVGSESTESNSTPTLQDTLSESFLNQYL